MSKFWENFIYILLGLIAVILIGTTIGLQLVILSNRQVSPPVSDQEIAGGRATEDASVSDLVDRLAKALLAPTNTSISAQIAPTPLPPTPTPLPPTLTPVPPTLAPATSTPAPPTLAPVTPTPIPPDALSTPVLEQVTNADLRFGYIDRGKSCLFFTDAVILALGQQLQIESIPFNTSVELFDALGNREIDITLCYIDPDDRTLMRDRLGRIRQIGTQYLVADTYKLQVWSNGGSKADLRSDRPCVLNFLEHIDFTGLEIQNQTPQDWLQANTASFDSWLDCSLSE